MGNNPDGRPSGDDVSRVNEELLERVARTKAAYERMKISVAELSAVREHLGSLHPDGTQATLNALRMQRAVTREYIDAIKALTDFTLHQKVPRKAD
jgi:hypothetical protein